MGADPGDDHGAKNEKPQHEVKITRPFYLALHEVTVAQFRRFVEDEKYKTKAEIDDQGAWSFGTNINGKIAFVQKAGINWTTRPAKTVKGDHPVTSLAWSDAVAYCAWLSKKEGKTYRLPTEAEWEYACRAGTTTPYSFGKSMDKQKANLGAAKTPMRVGYYPPNPFGLYDMHGNVGEWCLDGPRSYVLASVTDPVGTGNARVYRGGQWYNSSTVDRPILGSSYQNAQTAWDYAGADSNAGFGSLWSSTCQLRFPQIKVAIRNVD